MSLESSKSRYALDKGQELPDCLSPYNLCVMKSKSPF